ncbi:response regulator transcription factor [Candidatus Nitrospira bockiana]
MMKVKSKLLDILIVDDHEIVRLGLRTMLDLVPGIRVVGEAATGQDALSQTMRLQPDLVLLDIRLPDRSGIDICRDIVATSPQTRVLFLTSFADDETVLSAVVAGAQGYVLKDATNTSLIEAIRTVGGGQSLLDPQVTTHTLSFIRDRYNPAGAMPTLRLSPQEERVLRLVAEGKTNKEIAADLRLSDKTVKNYLSNIYDKLDVNRRSQATAIYLKSVK